VEFRRLALPEVILVLPDVHRDARGFFLETYHARKYREGGIDAVFVQDNQSRSKRGTLRGLHAQVKSPQGKLVRAVSGEIFDVAVDIRPASPTFGRWVGATLTAANAEQLWVPPGFGHGFCVLSDVADFVYKCTSYYDPATESGIRFDDPDVGIEWPADVELLYSERDRVAPRLADVIDDLPFRYAA
jgi:dTDP-4-dehydrorhamnose 3,5-epimerase